MRFQDGKRIKKRVRVINTFANQLYCKPHNVVTLVRSQTDFIFQMIKAKYSQYFVHTLLHKKHFGTCINFKQWQLASEFGECEYSPKIRQIFVTRSGEFGEY